MIKESKPKATGWRRGVKIAFNVVYILMIAFMLYVFAAILLSRDNMEETYIFGYKPLAVQSGSMEPVIRTHSIVIAQKVEAKDIKVGDIAVYKQDLNDPKSRLIVHRVIEVVDGGFRFQGDNNSGPDPYIITDDMIRCRVVLTMNWTEPVIRRISNPDGTLNVWNIVIWLVLALILLEVVSYLLKRRKKLREAETEKAEEQLNTVYDQLAGESQDEEEDAPPDEAEKTESNEENDETPDA